MVNSNNPNTIRKMLGSDSPSTRRKAFDSLYRQIQGKLKAFFFYRTKNWEDAADLLQDTFVKLYEIWGTKKHHGSTIPRAYIYTTARNILVDFYRKHKNDPQFSLEDTSPSKIHKVMDTMQGNDIKTKRKLCFHIKRQSDRFLATTRILFDISPNQYSILTGLDLNNVYNSMRRIKRASQKIREQKDFYLSQAHPWQKELHFTMDNQPISVAYVNVNPTNFHPDCWHELKKDLDVSSLAEFRKQFITILRTEGIDPNFPSMFLTFTPRSFFSREVFRDAKELPYASYSIDFINEGKHSNEDEYLVLYDKIEFTGRVTGNYDRENNRWLAFEYQFLSLNMLSIKAFNAQLLNYQNDPYSREPTFYVYRNYPLNPEKPFPLLPLCK